MFTAQEILVGNADYPTEKIAENSRKFRQLGLGYANLGALLMAQGMPYDSDDGRAWAAAITALMTGHAYATSARTAGRMGPFAGYADNAEPMLNVLRMHRAEAAKIDEDLVPPELLGAAQRAWDEAVELGETFGVRNSQATVLAPTGCLVGGTLVPTERGLVRLGSLGDPIGDQWQPLDIDVQTDEGPATRHAVLRERCRAGRRRRDEARLPHPGHGQAPGQGRRRGRRVGLAPSRRRAARATAFRLRSTSSSARRRRSCFRRWRRRTGPRESHVRVPRDDDRRARRVRRLLHGRRLAALEGLAALRGRRRLRRRRAPRPPGQGALRPRGRDRASSTGYTEVAFHSVRLAQWWEACGFAKLSPREGHTGKGYTPHIPDAVLHSNDRDVYARVRPRPVRGRRHRHRGHPHVDDRPGVVRRRSAVAAARARLPDHAQARRERARLADWRRSGCSTPRTTTRWLDEIGFIWRPQVGAGRSSSEGARRRVTTTSRSPASSSIGSHRRTTASARCC